MRRTDAVSRSYRNYTKPLQQLTDTIVITEDICVRQAVAVFYTTYIYVRFCAFALGL